MVFGYFNATFHAVFVLPRKVKPALLEYHRVESYLSSHSHECNSNFFCYTSYGSAHMKLTSKYEPGGFTKQRFRYLRSVENWIFVSV